MHINALYNIIISCVLIVSCMYPMQARAAEQITSFTVVPELVTEMDNKTLMYTTGMTVGHTDAAYSLWIGEDSLKIKIREQENILHWLIALDFPPPFSTPFKDTINFVEDVKYMAQGIFNIENGEGLVESYINDNFFYYLNRFGSNKMENLLEERTWGKRTDFEKLTDKSLKGFLDAQSTIIDAQTLYTWTTEYPALIDYSAQYAYEAAQLIVNAIEKQYPDGKWGGEKAEYFVHDGKIIMSLHASGDIYNEVYIYRDITLPKIDPLVETPQVTRESLQLLLLDMYTAVQNKHRGTYEPMQTEYGEYASFLVHGAPVQPALPQEVENSIAHISGAIQNLSFSIRGEGLKDFDTMRSFYLKSVQNYMKPVADQYLKFWLDKAGDSMGILNSHLPVVNAYRQDEYLLPVQRQFLDDFYHRSVNKYITFVNRAADKFNVHQDLFFKSSTTISTQMLNTTTLMKLTDSLTYAARSVKAALPDAVWNNVYKRKELEDLVHAYLYTALYNKIATLNEYQSFYLNTLSSLYIRLIFDDLHTSQITLNTAYYILAHGFLNEIYYESRNRNFNSALDSLNVLDVNEPLLYLEQLLRERTADVEPARAQSGKPFKAFPYKETDNVNKKWTITFNQPIHQDTIDDIAYVVSETGQTIPLTIKQLNNKQISIQPKNTRYTKGEMYYLYIEDRITNEQSKSLANPIYMKFKVVQ